MSEKTNGAKASGIVVSDAIKNSVMIVLTLLFVGLYAAALTGWLRPLADVTMITRLEPIIFVIIGYYFGRLPAQSNERSLKQEIDRQTKNLEASLHAQAAAETEREIIEEKVKNAKIALKFVAGEQTHESSRKEGVGLAVTPESSRKLSDAVFTARQILDS